MIGLSKTVGARDWVVVLWDQDGAETSPWNVQADDLVGAIDKARSQWWRWLDGDETWDRDDGTLASELSRADQPDVHKVYRGSWIGDRVQ